MPSVIQLHGRCRLEFEVKRLIDVSCLHGRQLLRCDRFRKIMTVCVSPNFELSSTVHPKYHIVVLVVGNCVFVMPVILLLIAMSNIYIFGHNLC